MIVYLILHDRLTQKSNASYFIDDIHHCLEALYSTIYIYVQSLWNHFIKTIDKTPNHVNALEAYRIFHLYAAVQYDF